MTTALRLFLPAALALVAGCANPDTVVFVTNTSIGMDLGGTPPMASIAYDRMEGYIAPRYDNGAVPPVVASLETGGNIITPKIRQTYATGKAAGIATGSTTPAANELPLIGEQKKLMFFGTNTALGLRVGFTPAGIPDSITLGFKRKEVSIIPVGSMTCPSTSTAANCPAGLKVDTYASVLASIDTASVMTSPTTTGLDSRQFFATGIAAEQLAANDLIRKSFKSASEATPAAVKQQADEMIAERNAKVTLITTAITGEDGKLDKAKLSTLVDKASVPAPTASALKGADSLGTVVDLLTDSNPTTKKLAEALNK